MKNRGEIRQRLARKRAATHLNGVFDANVIQVRQMQRLEFGKTKHRERDEQHSEEIDISSQHYATPTLSSTIRPSNRRIVRSA